jgi:hypothetical protein
MNDNPIISHVLNALKSINENGWKFNKKKTLKHKDSKYIFQYWFLNKDMNESFYVRYCFNNANPMWFFLALPPRLSHIQSLKPFRFDILLIKRLDSNEN